VRAYAGADDGEHTARNNAHTDAATERTTLPGVRCVVVVVVIIGRRE
jgi:hypothetical protein